MKKTLKYIIIGLFTLVMYSCTEEFIEPDNEKPIVSGDKISFFADQDNPNNTKGIELTNANFTKFNVFAYSSVGLFNTTPTMTPFINNLTVSKSGNNWNYTGSYYWPASGYLHFYGVATDGASSGFPLGVTNWTAPNAQGYPKFSFQTQNTIANVKDLVTAKTKDKNMFNNTGRVALSFEHVLSEINFKITNSYGTTTRIKKITVSNIIKQGDYTFNANKGLWSFSTAASNKETIVFWSGSQDISNNGNANYTERLFVIPSTGIQVKIDYQTASNWDPLWWFPTNRNITLNLPAVDIGDNKRFNLTID